MAVIALLLSGWIGLAAALLGQLVWGADLATFLTVWFQSGFAALGAILLVGAAQRLRASPAPQGA